MSFDAALVNQVVDLWDRYNLRPIPGRLITRDDGGTIVGACLRGILDMAGRKDVIGSYVRALGMTVGFDQSVTRRHRVPGTPEYETGQDFGHAVRVECERRQVAVARAVSEVESILKEAVNDSSEVRV